MGDAEMSRRIFITGGTGFFGKSMLDYRLRHPEWEWADAEWVILSRSPDGFSSSYPCLAGQHGVSFVAGDVCGFTFPEGHFDAIIHAATSTVSPLPDSETERVILGGTCRVIDFAKAVRCRKVLFTSSGAVYGFRTEPAREDAPCCPTTVYGKGKLSAERMLLDSGLEVKIARCFAFVGPYLDRRHQYAIGNFIQDCIDGRPIAVNGDGTPLRSYLYSDDLVEWLFAILDRGRSGQVYNVGSDEAVSIKALAERVRSALGVPNPIEVGLRQNPAPASVYVPVVEKAEKEIGLKRRVPLDEAIRMSADVSCRAI